MMMAHDSSADRPQLSSESVTALTDALHRYAANESDLAMLQPSLRAIAEEARERKVSAEQLLVLLKDVWYQLPSVRDAADGDQQQMLQRVVTLCIREYYSR
jgi:hemoglobin-like flavoprotein